MEANGGNTLLKKEIKEEKVRSRKWDPVWKGDKGNSQDMLKGNSVTIVVYQVRRVSRPSWNLTQGYRKCIFKKEIKTDLPDTFEYDARKVLLLAVCK